MSTKERNEPLALAILQGHHSIFRGEIVMFIGKKKENNHSKKTNAMAPSSEDSVQSLRSWVRKIEQSTNSVAHGSPQSRHVCQGDLHHLVRLLCR